MTLKAQSAHPPRRSLDRLWIVVADGGVARILAISDERDHLRVLREHHSPDAHLKTHELVDAPVGRSFESASPTRHGIASRLDPHAEQKHHFIAGLAEALNQDSDADLFDQLVLIVTPAQSHLLLAGLNPRAAAKVLDSIHKDLTKELPQAIWERLIAAKLMPPRRPAA